MKLQPIIRVKLAKFREDYELQSVSDGIALRDSRIKLFCQLISLALLV